jgi:hypothetical protein
VYLEILFLQRVLWSLSFYKNGGSVTQNCVCVSQCERGQMSIWMMRWPNRWGAAGIWTCRKCQNNGQLVIMKLWGHHFYLFVVCFLSFCVVCKWWALFCILHGMGSAWHCSTWSIVLSLDGLRNGRQWIASIRQSFQSREAKFSDS